MEKIIISADLKAGTEITVCDYSKLAKVGEAVIEVHYNYDILNKYDVDFYPASFENAKIALSATPAAWMSKVVYHMPAEICIADLAQYDPTAEQLRAYGEKLADAENGVDAQLYYINGDRWVILPDQTVINYDLIGETDFSQPISFNI